MSEIIIYNHCLLQKISRPQTRFAQQFEHDITPHAYTIAHNVSKNTENTMYNWTSIAPPPLFQTLSGYATFTIIDSSYFFFFCLIIDQLFIDYIHFESLHVYDYHLLYFSFVFFNSSHAFFNRIHTILLYLNYGFDNHWIGLDLIRFDYTVQIYFDWHIFTAFNSCIHDSPRSFLPSKTKNSSGTNY